MYGENTGKLRTELTILLRQHRIQQRLGGPGTHTVSETTTVEERRVLGEQIARYRHAVLLWCLQATRAANPGIDLESTTRNTRGPAQEFRYRLEATVAGSTAGLPSLDELTATGEFPMVETWRQGARAAALGEHDFGAGVEYEHLSDAQCITVLTDTADISRGLIGLDRRYEHIPGWKKLKDPGQLARATEACAMSAGNIENDYSVDLQGWRPRPAVIGRPPTSGLGGVLQGEHNLLAHLAQFPDAHNLRLILDSQRIVSHQAATRARAISPALAKKWEARTETFTTLLRATRNLRGSLGNGGATAAQGVTVVSRMQKLDPHELTDSTELDQLDKLFSRVDAKLAQIIEFGASKRLYFLGMKIPRVVSESKDLIKPARERFVPINSPLHNDLLKLVRTQLRRPPVAPRSGSGAGNGRADFEAAITHRPTPRGVTPDVPSL